MKRTSLARSLAAALGVLVSAAACGPGSEPATAGAGDPVTWSRTYGGAGFDLAHPVQQTSDGGYIVGGGSWSYGPGTYDGWIVSLDPRGKERWSRAYGGGEGEEIRSLHQTADRGYALAGQTFSFGAGGGDAWVLRTDPQGNEVWSRTFGGLLQDIAHAVEETADGGLIVSGQTRSFGALAGNAFLLKTDADGAVEWSGSYGGPNFETAFSARQTADGGFVLAGETRSHSRGGADLYLVKTDGEGSETWTATFGGAATDGAHCVQQTSDGGFVLAGGTESSGQGMLDGWLVKTDAFGVEQWSRTFGGPENDILFYVEQTGDGGYIASGTTYSSGAGGGDFWLVRADSRGVEIWNRTFGGPGTDESYWLDSTGDGGFVLAGVTDSFGAGEGDFWVIKTDAAGNAPAAPAPSP